MPENTAVITFNAGDEHKNLETYQHLLGKLKEAGCDRKSVVLSLGGGVASDIVGFVAASYMRGIDWLAIPTTLMAQTDAAIGGKTGVNLGGFKNMIGSFWPPKATLVDPEFLETLDQRELSNGIAEIIKMGIIYDKSILNHLEKISADATLGKELDQASKLSAKGKVEIVNTDPF